MTGDYLTRRFRTVAQEVLPLPGSGDTPARLRRLIEMGLEDLSLAKLAEAHWDAVSILAEANREPENATYAVWASEPPSGELTLTEGEGGLIISGRKPFCSGLGLVDRALITVREPRPLLLDIDLQQQTERFMMDCSLWATDAFRATRTGTITFKNFRISKADIVGGENFYLDRPGFWNGACGPAACWVGGAAGLLTYAKQTKRDDPHTLAHLGAMDATLWMMRAALEGAGIEMDHAGVSGGMVCALRLRHIVEQGCTEILRRLTRAYGPHPLAMDAEVSRRYQELDVYLRQTHGERDLESLGRALLQLSA